ncbi:hypothetical protein GZH47_32220 (plasmid) [Paenibacillus rhizovicinus]|uniref:Uncharacterized protein n=1 Tax=Paenibacillus rhizovicinus TaxID=2704463 RepID=A0A6C0PCF1_9BACL|nr:hypothetical protein [Paenibacillus rhizovicinus]QHW35553.1 hypothetical protein GZH47_32220 [Paenibacillus rhizovicinus]
MAKAKIYPTCRICDKLNAEGTHCAIFGALTTGQVDNTAVGNACSKSGDYVRMLHAKPNEYNLGRTPAGKPIVDEEESQLLVFDADDETKGFQERHGMSLEEWAISTFGEKKPE